MSQAPLESDERADVEAAEGAPGEPDAPGALALARRQQARELLSRASEGIEDAGELLARRRVRSAVVLACEAIFDLARAFLVLKGLDAGSDLAGTTALFDRQVTAAGVLSEASSLAVHRALRLSRETREGTPLVIYPARVDEVVESARLLGSEAEIVLAEAIGDLPPEGDRAEEPWEL